MSSSTSTLASTSTRPALVPTNSVTTLDGITVKTRIDPSLTVDEVVRQLVTSPSLRQTQPPSHYALRDEADELVTNDNLRRKIKTRANLKLVNAPNLEAREIAQKLKHREDRTIRLTLFSLQKYIREEQFAVEFLNNDGLAELISVIDETSGNTLAYALTAMQNLMELEKGWATLTASFIMRVVHLIASPNSPINVCRPATAILKKLVEAHPSRAPNASSSSTGTPLLPPDSPYRFGFGLVFDQMRKARGFLETLVNRLGSAETAMAQYSMNLINALLTHVDDARWDEFIGELERLNVRKAVVRLMSLHEIEELTSCILDFQVNILRVTVRKKETPVNPEYDVTHDMALQAIWDASRLEEEYDEHGHFIKWRKLGFETEDISHEFRAVGILGLECLRSFVQLDTDFSMLMLEQHSRPTEKRCPIAKVSNEVVELLLDHWQAFSGGYSTTTTFQPFFLDFQKVHSLATHFFIRMWTESGAAVSDDFSRISDLVRSQIKASLKNEHVKQWHEVEKDFNCEYRKVRDRQMQELELEDKILSKVPVRNLRAKLYKESYEFVRQQRIQCLLQGAWFVNAIPAEALATRNHNRKPHRPWRFMRLDNTHKFLHYVDSAVKFPVRNGLEDLPDRIDVSMISEIATGTCAPPPNVLRGSSDLPSAAPPALSELSFSLLSAHEGSLADQIAPDQSRWADWTDGLNMLRRDGGHVSSKETAGFVQALTEIGLKIKLLDLSAEPVDLPDGLTAGPPPTNCDFFFSDII